VPIGVTPDRFTQLRLSHVIEEQCIEVNVAQEDRAFAVMERIGELNRARLLALIDRIFDEFDRPGEVIRIDRLDLDLGRLAEAEIDGKIERLLEAALRKALRKAMPPPLPRSAMPDRKPSAGSVSSSMPVEFVLIDILEHWLLHGIWPWRSGLDGATAPADLLDRLIGEEPAALVSMLRRRGRSDSAVRRLVEQMPHTVLKGLLRKLGPAHSAFVLAFMAQARAAHKVEPVVEQPPERFARTLWTIVLRDALHSAGLRANRRAFVGNLVTRLAEADAIPFDWLLRRLQAGLEAGTETGADSLLSIVAEIGSAQTLEAVELPKAEFDFTRFAAIAEGTAPLPADKSDCAALRMILLGNAGASSLLLRRLARGDPNALARRLQGLLTPQVFAGLLTAAGPLRADDPLRELAEAAANAGGESPRSRSGQSRRDALGSPGHALGADSRAHLQLEQSDLGRKAAQAGEDALAFLDAVLASDAATGVVEAALNDAANLAPVATRRLLRRYARADAAALLYRVGPSNAPFLFRVILAREAAEAFAALAAVRENRHDAHELLITVATELPVSAAPALLLERAVERLAEASGTASSALRAELAEAARESGARAGRRLAAQLQALEVPSDAADTPEQRRLRALDLLRAMAAGSTAAAESLPPLLPSLSGLSPQRLRAALAGLSPHHRAFTAVLARLKPADLLRLAFLLAPAQVERAALRGRLTAGAGRDALAQIVASLLIAGALPPATIRPPRPEPIGDGVLADALARGGSALRTQAARRAIAWAMRQSQGDLLAATARRIDSPAARLLANPGTAAVLFGAAHPAEQLLLRDLARLLSGAAGRNAMPPEKAAAALLTAATEATKARRPAGWAGLWLRSLLAGASLPQRAALLRLIDRRWPDTQAHAPLRRALGLGARAASPGPARPAPGSPAWLVWLLDERPAGWERRLRAALASPDFRARAARSLPQALLARSLAAAAPRESGELLRAAELLRSAFAEAGGGLSGIDLWQALLASAIAPPGATIAALLSAILDRHPSRDAVEPALARRAAAAGRSALSAALEEGTMPPKRNPKRLVSKPPVPSENSAQPEEGMRIAIANAGLVLATPYLPPLFERLGLIGRNPEGRLAWLSPEARDRAIHLLQYLVEGRCDRPEPMLALNKLLCGQPLSAPTSAGIEPTEQEREMCASLLQAMLAHWPMLKGSSASALQETFFQRAGALVRTGEGWQVEVERKVLDILVDSVPWSFATILHPWMPEPLTVAW
jgi:Contractile injection system tape measure protein